VSASLHPTSYRPGVYQPALDGLRALSISAVLLYHDDLLQLLPASRAGLALAAAAWRFALFSMGSTPWRLYNGTDSRADSLLIGCGAALAMTDRRFLEIVRDSRLARWLALAAAALLVFLMKGTPLDWVSYDRGVFLVVAIAVAMIVVVILTNPELLATQILSTKPLVWLTRLSYSLSSGTCPSLGSSNQGRWVSARRRHGLPASSSPSRPPSPLT
jgi:peptidoglycan/LPS O-acetylase OafA/YrhL